MESFLEANQVVEVSLSKLASIKRTGDLPLRKTLMVSRVLSRAQEAASSVQDSLLWNHMNSSRCSSKLLASFANNQSNVDVDSLPASQTSLKHYHSREQSPIAIESHDLLESMAPQQPDQEPMDLENVNSFLDTILQDSDSKMELSQSPCRSPLKEVHNSDDTRPFCPNAPSDHTFSRSESTTLPPGRPVSPGKRNYQQAFPFITEQLQPLDQDSFDLKRFKACTGEALDSLPGFCGYLSTKNLQTAPFITYMFGKGFTHPSNINSDFNDWPVSFGHEDQDLITSNTTVSPILAF